MRKLLTSFLADVIIVCFFAVSIFGVSANGTRSDEHIAVSSLEFVFDETPDVGKKIVLPKLVAVNGEASLVEIIDTSACAWWESEVGLSFSTFTEIEPGGTFQKGMAYKLCINLNISEDHEFLVLSTVTVRTPEGELVGVGYATRYNKQYQILLNFGAPTNFITIKNYDVKLYGYQIGKDIDESYVDIYVNGVKRNKVPLKMNIAPVGISTTDDPDKMTILYDKFRENQQYYLSLAVEDIPNYTIDYDNLSIFKVNGIKAFKKIIFNGNEREHVFLFKLPILHRHNYVTKHKKATFTADGNSCKTCSVCGKAANNSSTIIKSISSVKLSASSYTYNGKIKTPSIIVKDRGGNKIPSTYYSVKYASGRKKVGKYSVTVKFKGKYSGTKTLYFTIKPVKTTVLKLSAGKKKIKVYIAKKNSQVTGYQIQYSTSKTFKSAKTKTILGYNVTSTVLKSLSAKKKYYVRIRTYKTVKGNKYYSGWSTYKYKTTK